MQQFEKRKLNDEWRALNLSIPQKVRQIEMNIKANRPNSEEYVNWVNDLIARRDYLTNII